MLVITTLKEAKQVKFGDQYFVDVYPEPPVTDEEIEGFGKAFQKAQELEARIEKQIADNLNDVEEPKKSPPGKDKNS